MTERIFETQILPLFSHFSSLSLFLLFSLSFLFPLSFFTFFSLRGKLKFKRERERERKLLNPSVRFQIKKSLNRKSAFTQGYWIQNQQKKILSLSFSKKMERKKEKERRKEEKRNGKKEERERRREGKKKKRKREKRKRKGTEK